MSDMGSLAIERNIIRACQSCGQPFVLNGGPRTEFVCASCRQVIVDLFNSYDAPCRDAYCRGRIAAARDNNDLLALRELGSILDKLRA